MMEDALATKVEKKGNRWVVRGMGRGWIFGKTFPTKWKAHLALKVFNEGGRISDYWFEARKGKEVAKRFKKLEHSSKPKDSTPKRKKRKPRLRGVVVLKIECTNCNYTEVPIMHTICATQQSPVIGRLLLSKSRVICEECNEIIPKNQFSLWICKKCGKSLRSDFDKVSLPV